MSARAEIAFEVCGTLAASFLMLFASMFSGSNISQLGFLVAGAIAGTVIIAYGGTILGLDIGLPMRAKISVHVCAAIILGPLALNVALQYLPTYEPDAIACAVGGMVSIFGALVLMAISKWFKKQVRKKMK